MARTARFATLTCSVAPAQMEAVTEQVRERLDNYGATEILISSSAGFLSVTFVLHGSHATETGVQAVQQHLTRLLREYRATETLMTSEPEPEETPV